MFDLDCDLSCKFHALSVIHNTKFIKHLCRNGNQTDSRTKLPPCAVMPQRKLDYKTQAMRALSTDNN